MDVSPDTIEINDAHLLQLVARDAPVERLCTGFRFSEGPIWNPREQMPLLQRHAQRHPPPLERGRGGVVEVRNPSNKCNGMTYDAAGNLYVCEHVTSSLVMETPAGERQVLATHWQGKELNSPNDVVLRSDGTIYFTDPTYGRTPVFGRERPVGTGLPGASTASRETARLHCEANDFDQPNGLCLSPDERILYVNDTERAHIRAFDVARRRIAERQPRLLRAGRHRQLRRGRRRRHEVRRARQRLRHRSARHLGDQPEGTHLGIILHAGGRRKPELGRAGLDRPLLRLLDLDLPRADEGTRQSGRLHADGLIGRHAEGPMSSDISTTPHPAVGGHARAPASPGPAAAGHGAHGVTRVSGRRRQAGLRAGRAGQHHSRCLARRLWRRRRGDSHRAGQGNDLAGRRRQHGEHPGGDRQGRGAAARPERLPRHGAAPGRLLPDGHAHHDHGQRHRAARRRHGRHRDHPGRHRHGTAGGPAADPRDGRGALTGCACCRCSAPAAPAAAARRRPRQRRARRRLARWRRSRWRPGGVGGGRGGGPGVAGAPGAPGQAGRGRGGGGFGGGPATLIRVAGAAGAAPQDDTKQAVARRVRAGRRPQLQGRVRSRLQAGRHGDRPAHRQPGLDRRDWA